MGNRKRGKEGAGKGIHNNVLHANHFHTSDTGKAGGEQDEPRQRTRRNESRRAAAAGERTRAHKREREGEKEGAGEEPRDAKREKVSTNPIRG